MGKDTFDAVLASVPLNRTAGVVTSKGDEYAPKCTPPPNCWDAPPRLAKPMPKTLDLTGHRCGRLTVIGLLPRPEKRNKHALAVWVCRCDCGIYEGRSAKAIRNPKNQHDRCHQCRHTEFLRRQAKWIADGMPAPIKPEGEAK